MTLHNFCLKLERENFSLGYSFCGSNVTLTVCFLIMLFVLFIVQYCFRRFEILLHSTPSLTFILPKFYREMTCLGVLSFFNLICRNTVELMSESWERSFGHVELVIFAISFLYVLQIFIYMIFSLYQEKFWKLTTNIGIDQLMNEFQDHSFSVFSRWIPYFKYRDQLEYKIFIFLYCHKHHVKKNEFNFTGYLCEASKRYLINLLDDNYIMRMFLTILIVIHYIVIKYKNNSMKNCNGNCALVKQLTAFSIFGLIILILSIMLVIISRFFIISFLSCGDLKTFDDCMNYLKKQENSDLKKLSKSQLRTASQRKSLLSNTFSKNDIKKTIKKINTLSTATADLDDDDDEVNTKHYYTFKRFIYQCKKIWLNMFPEKIEPDDQQHDERIEDDEDGLDAEKVDGDGDTPRSNRTKLLLSSKSFSKRVILEDRVISGTGLVVHLTGQTAATSASASASENNDMKDLNRIFLSPWFNYYLRSVKWLLFANSVYSAFWVTNFALLATESSQPAMWQLFMVLPALLTSTLMAYTVQASCLLQALSSLNPDVMGKVIEEDEAAENACAYLRVRLMRTLKRCLKEKDSLLEQKLLLNRLVEECGTGNSGSMSHNELRIMLSKLNLHFTDKTVQHVIDAIEIDQSGTITPEELFYFLYPEERVKSEMSRRKQNTGLVQELLKMKKRSSFGHVGDALLETAEFMGQSVLEWLGQSPDRVAPDPIQNPKAEANGLRKSSVISRRSSVASAREKSQPNSARSPADGAGPASRRCSAVSLPDCSMTPPVDSKDSEPDDGRVETLQ